jgi:hypothetical protein
MFGHVFAGDLLLSPGSYWDRRGSLLKTPVYAGKIKKSSKKIVIFGHLE